MTDDPYVLEETANGIATLTLNRPKARNALSLPMLLAIQESLATVAANPQARVVVIKGSGPAFCAGHDLKKCAPNPSTAPTPPASSASAAT